jgi:cystathionine beta-lyase
MEYNFNQTSNLDRSIFVRYNPIYLKKQFGSPDVLPFWVADSDFDIMPELQEALKRTAERGIFAYEYKSKHLKAALAGWFERRYDIAIEQQNLMFTTSVLTSLAAIIDEFSREQDGIIIQPPVYQAFETIITSLDRTIVNNPLLLEDGKYIIDFADLQNKAELQTTKMMILCSPHNPVGRVWKQEELERIANICKASDILLITDEIHADIVYPGNRFIGMTSVYKSISNNIIMVGSAGKSFGIPGLVDSFIYTPDRNLKTAIQKRIMKYHLGKSNAFANTALETVYTLGDHWLDAFVEYLYGNVEFIKNFLAQELPTVKMIKPEGTYQVWLDFNAFNMPEKTLMKKLGEEAGVGLNNGSSYGPGGDKYCRMNIACPRESIEEAMRRIKGAFATQ